MEWRSECSADWMRERAKVITATEVRSLVKEWRRYKKRYESSKSFVPPMMWKLFCDKATPQEPCCVSTGAAARGHAMEQFAIDEFNDRSRIKFHHWDDVIVMELDP